MIADPDLEGGGHLNLHADFTVHFHPHLASPREPTSLSEHNWKKEWKDAIEFCDRETTRCVVKVQPILNHALIFTTNDDSYHGFPDALECPERESRMSVALYYYTISDSAVAHATAWKSRPGDTKGQAGHDLGGSPSHHRVQQGQEQARLFRRFRQPRAGIPLQKGRCAATGRNPNEEGSRSRFGLHGGSLPAPF
jgi:hypothetical protein